MKRIGILTSGGDSPGMNAAIRSFVRSGIAAGLEIIGIESGYEGLFERKFRPLLSRDVGMIIHQGGTFLKTSRSEKFRTPEGQKLAAEILTAEKLDGLCVIGGDGSFRGMLALEKFWPGQLIGIPGTIDNDIPGTDYTIGFGTAVETAVWAIDKIRDTASSHDRMIFVEVMGRHSGQIALHVALACGAEDILVPEEVTDLQAMADRLQASRARGKKMGIVVIAEGDDAGGAFSIAEKIKKLTGVEIKVSVLGYIQRGGPPTAHERVTASRMGAHALDLFLAGKSMLFTAVRKGEITETDLITAASGIRALELHQLDLVRSLA